MEKFIVGLADDEDIIHNMIDTFVATLNTDSIKVEHFYFTSEVEDFLYDNPNGIDMLLLDVCFEDSTSGIAALPVIREYAPELPIYLFTANDIPTNDILALSDKYNIEFVQKPVKAGEILTKIQLLKKYTDNYRHIKNSLLEHKQYIDLIEEDLERINLEKALEQETFKNYIDKINSHLETNKQIPKDVKILVQEVFPNLEFTPYVLVEILGKNFDKGVYKILKPLNDNTPLPAGAKKKHFVEWGINNLYEYRLSKKSRIFVQERSGQKPLIYAIDYNHDKH